MTESKQPASRRKRDSKRLLNEVALVQEISKALEGIIHGEITITVRDNRVVQVERRTLHRCI